MSVGDVLAEFTTGTYTVRRAAVRTHFVGGTGRPPDRMDVTIQASVLPMDGRELERLPEGMRGDRQLLVVYTTTELQTQRNGFEPDIIEIDGNDYEVQTVKNWSQLGGYWKAIVQWQRRTQ